MSGPTSPPATQPFFILYVCLSVLGLLPHQFLLAPGTNLPLEPEDVVWTWQALSKALQIPVLYLIKGWLFMASVNS